MCLFKDKYNVAVKKRRYQIKTHCAKSPVASHLIRTAKVLKWLMRTLDSYFCSLSHPTLLQPHSQVCQPQCVCLKCSSWKQQHSSLLHFFQASAQRHLIRDVFPDHSREIWPIDSSFLLLLPTVLHCIYHNLAHCCLLVQ